METEIRTTEVLALEPVNVPRAVTVQPESRPVSQGEAFMLGLLDRGAKLDEIERIMNLKDRMDAKTALQQFNEAFSLFKAESIRIIKNTTVKDGPLKGRGYAELFAVVDAVTPALSRFGLSTAWKRTKDEAQWIEVTCVLRHVGGHSETVSMGGPPDSGGAKNAIQARQSTESYLQRYTLKSILGVAEGGEDNDGAGATDDVMLDALRDAAMEGTEQLRAAKARLNPSVAIWGAHSTALKTAALAADSAIK